MHAKQVMDFCLSIIGIIILSPIYLIIIMMIKIDSPGPIFFRQIRVGKNGRSFMIYKFRTMIIDAENKGKQITIGEDDRITRCGKFLRKYKLDELPQLFNVLKGEMSLVGPRPEVPCYVGGYPESVKKIVLSVPPGITDFASIEYRNETELLGSVQEPEKIYLEQILPAKLTYAVKYVNERNIWLDLKILFLTFLVLLNFKSKYRGQPIQELASTLETDKKKE